MKHKYLLLSMLISILLISIPCYGTSGGSGGGDVDVDVDVVATGGIANATGGTADVDVSNVNINGNTNLNHNTNINSTTNRNSLNQNQGQIQGQKQNQRQNQRQNQNQNQGQSQVSKSSANNKVSTNNEQATSVNIEDTREYPVVTPPIVPNTIPLLPGGVANMTAAMPNFPVKPLQENEVVIAVKVFNGWCLNRIRLEDVETDLLDEYAGLVKAKKWDVAKIRYQIWQKDSVSGSGTSGGVSGIISNVNGSTGTGGGASLLPGFNRSTVDPQYVVKFYLVQ